jgi:hypothetical protein
MIASLAVVEDIDIYGGSGGLSPNAHDVACRIVQDPGK